MRECKLCGCGDEEKKLNMQEDEEDIKLDIKDILLTAGVIAAVIGSITNIIIALFNSSQLKKIENIKKDNQMNTTRMIKTRE